MEVATATANDNDSDYHKSSDDGNQDGTLDVDIGQ